MSKTIEGSHDATGLRFGIIASRFNDEIVSGLLRGALACLERHGAAEDAITIVRVPGAFEIPAITKLLVGRFDAIVTIGCLIRGETAHFDMLAAQCTNELSRIAVDSGFPISFGVITCNTLEQAVARSSPGSGNKGWEAALAAIEMANLWRALRTGEK